MRASNLLWAARDHSYSSDDYYYPTVSNSPTPSSSSSSSLTNYEPRKIAPFRPIIFDDEKEKQQNSAFMNTTASKASLNRNAFPSTMNDRIVDHINQVVTSVAATSKATQLPSAANHVTSITAKKAKHNHKSSNCNHCII